VLRTGCSQHRYKRYRTTTNISTRDFSICLAERNQLRLLSSFPAAFCLLHREGIRARNRQTAIVDCASEKSLQLGGPGAFSWCCGAAGNRKHRCRLSRARAREREKEGTNERKKGQAGARKKRRE